MKKTEMNMTQGLTQTKFRGGLGLLQHPRWSAL